MCIQQLEGVTANGCWGGGDGFGPNDRLEVQGTRNFDRKFSKNVTEAILIRQKNRTVLHC